ncbi:hypothetical protein [Sphaerimonospora mesophila]|uniref:hypothetical protein n=1 Tax=Sphaerimonospora mesophila TaxID=37483 RepID=UPI00128F413B
MSTLRMRQSRPAGGGALAVGAGGDDGSGGGAELVAVEVGVGSEAGTSRVGDGAFAVGVGRVDGGVVLRLGAVGLGAAAEDFTLWREC